MPSPLLQRARQTLAQVVSRYSEASQTGAAAGAPPHQAAVKTGLGQLQSLSDKLESRCLRVAVFGLVSRGKSAVINALVGENLLETGPLHGVTRWPRSVSWQVERDDAEPWQIELIDTPGLDEVGGEVRADMAQTVAAQADLILFVVAGDITQLEYDALLELQRGQKPLLLVFNKVDLYPEIDRQGLYDSLQQLRTSLNQASPMPPIAAEQVVMVAASPAPLRVHIEWPDGRTGEEWEPQPPQIEPLRSALLTLIGQDGAALVALNALRHARTIEADLVGHVSRMHSDRANDLIWQFAKYKAAAVALNPIAGLDLLGGVLTDLVMIRTLARLYGFPITGHEAGQLWRAILKSSGTLVLSELGSGLLGAGKTTAALVTLVDSASGVAALAGAMTAQASAAGYGTYTVGQAAKTYLEQGCTWGPEGVSATLVSLLNETDRSTTLAQLRQEVQAELVETAIAKP